MKKIHIRTIIIGLLISWGVEVLIPLIHTIIDFIIRTNLRYPLTHYLLWGYLAVVLSGIYVGFSKTNSKVINGIVVGIFYHVTYSLFVGVMTNRPLWDSLFSFGYEFLTRSFICAIVAWVTYKIKIWLKIGVNK